MQESSEGMPLLPPSGMFDGCITCPSGQYYDWINETCASCPPNMILPDPFAMGPGACQECGPGLVSLDGQNCITTCTVSIEDSFYDLRKLATLVLPLYVSFMLVMHFPILYSQVPPISLGNILPKVKSYLLTCHVLELPNL